MSPSSVLRWGKDTELNHELAKYSGLVTDRQGSVTLSRLRRTQDAKFVIPQYENY